MGKSSPGLSSASLLAAQSVLSEIGLGFCTSSPHLIRPSILRAADASSPPHDCPPCCVYQSTPRVCEFEFHTPCLLTDSSPQLGHHGRLAARFLPNPSSRSIESLIEREVRIRDADNRRTCAGRYVASLCVCACRMRPHCANFQVGFGCRDAFCRACWRAACTALKLRVFQCRPRASSRC